nr:hypothetical protein YJOPZNRJ_YJOPZNRJ_CDS_0009 [Microvirus sp.]
MTFLKKNDKLTAVPTVGRCERLKAVRNSFRRSFYFKNRSFPQVFHRFSTGFPQFRKSFPQVFHNLTLSLSIS